jgi:hypothetical protein
VGVAAAAELGLEVKRGVEGRGHQD